MTVKYQRPTSTYIGNAVLPNRSKYQNDAAAQPKIPISSNKIDSDINYVIDALNDIDEASGTAPSIAGRLDTSLNADGSLKASASSVMDDWVVDSLTSITRISDTSFSCDGDQTATYTVNRRVLVSLPTADVYASVKAVSFTIDTTTVELVGITDSTGVNAVIDGDPTAVKYSSIITGVTGNAPDHYTTLHTEDIKVVNDDAAVRLKDQQVAGKEFAVRSSGGAVDFVENTGTEEAPVWTSRAQVDSSGFVLSDDAIGLNHLAHGTADKLIGFDATGVPAEVDQAQVAAATETVAGIAQIASNSDMWGTGTDKIVTPKTHRDYTAYIQRVVSGELTITAGADHSFTSGSGFANGAVNAWLVCKVADTTYAVGDRINIGHVDHGSAYYGCTVRMRDSNDTAYVRVAQDGINLLNSTGSVYSVALANFKLQIEILRS